MALSKNEDDTSSMYIILPVFEYNQLKKHAQKSSNSDKETLSDQMNRISMNPALAENTKLTMYKEVLKNHKLHDEISSDLENSSNKKSEVRNSYKISPPRNQNERSIDDTETSSNNDFQKKLNNLWDSDIYPDKVLNSDLSNPSNFENKSTNKTKKIKNKKKKKK